MREVALVAQAELLNCLESWKTRKAPCIPAARLALIPLPRAGREAEAAVSAAGISDSLRSSAEPTPAVAGHKDSTPVPKPDRADGSAGGSWHAYSG